VFYRSRLLVVTVVNTGFFFDAQRKCFFLYAATTDGNVSNRYVRLRSSIDALNTSDYTVIVGIILAHWIAHFEGLIYVAIVFIL